MSRQKRRRAAFRGRISGRKKRTGAGAGVSGFASRQFSGIMGGGGGSEMDRSVYLFQPCAGGKNVRDPADGAEPSAPYRDHGV